MIILLSPAKTLNETFPDFLPNGLEEEFQRPMFWQDTKILGEILTEKSPLDIQNLMHVSEKIADLNFGRYQSFPQIINTENSYPALNCFEGDVYKKIKQKDYSKKEWQFAQSHVRILSGLYGLLRPLDLMYPYRLEMGTKLLNPRGKNLYEFWGDSITDAINAAPSSVVVNLASQEYFKVIKPKQLTGRLIHIDFKTRKKDQWKTVGILAKRARGTMTNWIIKNQIINPDKLKEFTEDDYQFMPQISDKNHWTFGVNN